MDLRQEDALSCILFNIALEKVIKDSMIETKGTIYNKTIHIFAYAYIVLVRRTTGMLKEAIINHSKAVKEWTLQSIREKLNIRTQTKGNLLHEHLKLMNMNLKG
jgi:sorting nexin-29